MELKKNGKNGAPGGERQAGLPYSLMFRTEKSFPRTEPLTGIDWAAQFRHDVMPVADVVFKGISAMLKRMGEGAGDEGRGVSVVRTRRSGEKVTIRMEFENDVKYGGESEEAIAEMQELLPMERRVVEAVDALVCEDDMGQRNSLADALEKFAEKVGEVSKVCSREDNGRFLGLSARKLLAFAGALRSQEPIGRTVLDIGGLTRDAANFRSFVEEIETEICIEEGLLVRGNRIHVERMIGNLLENAYDAAGKSGVVRAGAARNGKWVEMYVFNTGNIPEEIIGRIFERGFTTKGRGGQGLGLASVKETAEYYGGSVWAENFPEQGGVLFTARLPALD